MDRDHDIWVLCVTHLLHISGGVGQVFMVFLEWSPAWATSECSVMFGNVRECSVIVSCVHRHSEWIYICMRSL